MMEKVRFLRTWRWFGPNDPVKLKMIRETPATGIITALHHIPTGKVWPESEIMKRKNLIESHGFSWEVVESVVVHEEIKYRGKNSRKLIENYKQTITNLGRSGIRKICYNFMPAIDWIRTDLRFPLKNGYSMLFDMKAFAAFDVFMLRRPGAEADYEDATLNKAKAVYENMSQHGRDELMYNIIVVTQDFIGAGVGDVPDYRKAFLSKLEKYNGMTSGDLFTNLSSFLHEVLPVAEDAGVIMCLHPDDPPFPVLGLPRIAGTLDNYLKIMEAAPSISNGITFCTGSLSSYKNNSLVHMLKKLISHIHFAHLRNTIILDNEGSFCESGHVEGSVDMKNIINLMQQEMTRRRDSGMKNWQIPMRPDHGIVLPEDAETTSLPGYPYHGRKRGLEELVALEEEIIQKN